MRAMQAAISNKTPKSQPAGTRRKSINRLQFFARFKPDRFAGGDRNLCSGSRIAADAGLSRSHVEHAKSSQLNTIAASQGLLHALEHGLDSHLGFGLGNAGFCHHFVNDIELNHERPPDAASEWCLKCLMLREISEIVNGSIRPVNWRHPIRFSELHSSPGETSLEESGNFAIFAPGFRSYCLLCFNCAITELSNSQFRGARVKQ